MTSLHPDSHGVVSGTVSKGAVTGQQILSEELVRLPELLRGAGYRTFGLTANGHLAGDLGYAKGFDRYENLGFGASAEDVNGKLQEWLEEIEGASPWFLWLHYFDPHAPYKAREPWLSRFTSGMTVEEPGSLVVSRVARYLEMGIGKSSAELEYIKALYDGEIGYTDQAIGRVLQLLDPGSKSLVVVTSDHGEEFLDHRSFGHEGTLFEELIAIPLIVRFPGERYAGSVVEGRVSLVDIAPSLLDSLGVGHSEALQGKSFMPLLDGRSPDLPRPVISSLARFGDRHLDAIVLGDWKFIRCSGKMPCELLYNLERDPGEDANVAVSHPAKKTELENGLRQQLAKLSSAPEPEFAGATDERLKELRSLGYVE
jgi:arylsulfatase A-like enzyme